MSDGDEDWFERAFREDSKSGSEDSKSGTGDTDSEPDAPDSDSGGSGDDGGDDVAGDGADDDADAATAAGSDPSSRRGEQSADSVDEDDPFGTDFATAFQNAPDLGGPGDGQSAGDPGGFGGGADVDGSDPFGGSPGGSPESFDEADLDSDIARLDIGIEGLDEMILGGIPKRALMVAIGSAGTGKTTFGMQFLHTALADGDSAVYISLEEGRDRILNTADEKGWEFSQYERDGQLAIVDFDPVEMANSLASIQNELPHLIREFGADRLVLDSVSLLEMMYDHPSKRRTEVFDFTKSLKQAGVTTFVTSEASQESPYASRHGIIEYLADAVFLLQYVRPSDFQETRLAIEIQKIRDANHSRETKPYEISNEGIEVYQQATIF